jgi:hypothetical protein
MKLTVSESKEQGMWKYITKSEGRVRQALDLLVARGKSIAVKIQGEQTLFDSKIVEADHGDLDSKSRIANTVYIEWLSPPEGNSLIQSSRAVQVKFSLAQYNFAFTSDYVTTSLRSSCRGHIISYPKALMVGDRRLHDRYETGSKKAPIFATATIKMKEGHTQVNLSDLGVFDVSENGVGILVDKKLLSRLSRIGIGTRLNGLELSAPWAIVKTHGIVKHMSKMRRGEYDGYHLLGIELDDKLEYYASDRYVADTVETQTGCRMSS